jgi:hypothetical protein
LQLNAYGLARAGQVAGLVGKHQAIRKRKPYGKRVVQSPKIMSWFFDAVPYVLAGGAILLGAFEIVKDWKEYKTAWLRMSVSVVFIIVATLAIASLRHDNQEKREAKNKADSDMKALQSKADAATQAQAENTRMYVESFTKMSGQISDLKAEVKTEALQKRLAAVQADLLKTQKAMEPGPRAELTFTFAPYSNPAPPGVPTLVKEVTAPLNSDGSIHIEFSIVNITDVDAIDNAINLVICEQCKYAKEPVNFEKIPGFGEEIRFLKVTVHAKEALQTTSLDIIPPARAGVTNIEVGFMYRCRTCVLHTGKAPGTTGIIHIVRP